MRRDSLEIIATWLSMAVDKDQWSHQLSTLIGEKVHNLLYSFSGSHQDLDQNTKMLHCLLDVKAETVIRRHDGFTANATFENK